MTEEWFLERRAELKAERLELETWVFKIKPELDAQLLEKAKKGEIPREVCGEERLQLRMQEFRCKDRLGQIYDQIEVIAGKLEELSA